MAIAYFDCFTGAAGDMIVGALLAAGADFENLRTELGKLKVGGFEIRSETLSRRGITCSQFCVDVQPGEKPHRHLSNIIEIIDSAGLAPRVADRAKRAFNRLAEAEAKVHNIDIGKVHFHEVGAVDSIVDIIGSAIAMEQLGIDKVFCSPVPLGRGTVKCEHGILPVPAPATAELLIGAETCPGPAECEGELTTPTAAAFFTALADGFGQPPEMKIETIGYGAGTREFGPLPNVLRVLIGQPSQAGTADTVIELAANIDDCTGEILGAVIEKLITAGCVDAWATPAFTKKSRPAWMLSALSSPANVAEAERIIFTETTTLGIRKRQCSRAKLERTIETVETSFGPIRIKLGILAGRVVTASPEFADCQAAAESHHVPIREVIVDAQRAYSQRAGK